MQPDRFDKYSKPQSRVGKISTKIHNNRGLNVAAYSALGGLMGLGLSAPMEAFLMKFLNKKGGAGELVRKTGILTPTRLKVLSTLLGAAGGAFLANNNHRAPVYPGAVEIWGSRRKPLPGMAVPHGLSDIQYRSPIQKQASQFSFPSIDTAFSRDLIDRDEFLDPFSKHKVTEAFDLARPAEQPSFISRKELMQGALRAGAGFVPAYLLGSGVGKILGMPKPVVDKLSTIGGIAGAVYNAGL